MNFFARRFDPDTIPRGPFEQLSWACDARVHGVEYADNMIKMARCEERMQGAGSTITITFEPARHYPVRCARRRR